MRFEFRKEYITYRPRKGFGFFYKYGSIGSEHGDPRQKGRKEKFFGFLRSFLGNKQYYLHLTDFQDKVQMSYFPRSDVDNPLGVYSYPISENIIRQFERQTLPYGMKMENVNIFIPHEEVRDKIIHIDGSFDDFQLKTYINRIYELYPFVFESEYSDFLEEKGFYDDDVDEFIDKLSEDNADLFTDFMYDIEISEKDLLKFKKDFLNHTKGKYRKELENFLSQLENEETEYENEKKFLYVKRPTQFKEWSQLFCDTHKQNGKIALVYYVAALFRDFIYDRFKFFPHLFGFGPPSTGKSTLGWSLSYMFGVERKPFNLNAGTAPGFYRTFAQYRNAIVWFDEYANSIDIKRIQDLKNAYDGAGHVKGDWSTGGNSNKTVTTPVYSGCYISGQELPTYLRAADVFVLNSGYEGFSHQILEAMLCEVPVIASAVGGNREIIQQGKNGFLVPYNDEFNITEAIKAIWNSQEILREIVSAGSKTADKFNMARMYQETVKILLNDANMRI